MNNKIIAKNMKDAKQQINKFVKNASNEDLMKFFNETDTMSIGHSFNDEFKLFDMAANPEYGYASNLLSIDMKETKKADFIIISTLLKDCIDIKQNIEFIPFNKMFFECGIRIINNNQELKYIDSFIAFKDKVKKKLRIYFTYKDINTNKSSFSVISINEADINSKKFEVENPKGVINSLELDNGFFEAQKDILKIIRYVSYKISTKEFRDYKICKNGQLINKELIYSSEVKAHKRHFWEDTGRFIIPTLPKEEILKRGYGIDDLVYKDNELRRNVPYIIIGNSIRNKELEKQNRRIDLIKKRIWKCEEKVYGILREIYPDKIIRRHDRRTLKGLELDFNLPELRLGIEYDGEQHFDEELYKKLYGDGFHSQVKRDRIKNVACRRKKIKLVRIKYDEKLTVSNIKKLISKPFQYAN
jgi:hypothetical protein